MSAIKCINKSKELTSYVQGEHIIMNLTLINALTKMALDWGNVTDAFAAHPLKAKDTFLIKSKSEAAAVAEVSQFKAVADEGGSLNQKFTLLNDPAGSVAFWSDNNDSGSDEPEHGANRAVKITTIADDDDKDTVAAKWAAGINGDSQFAGAVTSGEIFTATDATPADRADGDAGDSGFDFSVLTQGKDLLQNGGIELPSAGNMTITIPSELSIDLLGEARTILDVTIDRPKEFGGRKTYRIENAYEMKTRKYDIPDPA